MKLKCLIIYLNVCGILWLCKWLKNKCATLCAALVAGRIDQIYAKFACWQHKIDIREEAADETAKRILYTLSILKHRLPTDMTRLYFCLSLSAVINDSQFLQRGAMLALYYRHDMTYSVLKVPLNPNQPTNVCLSVRLSWSVQPFGHSAWTLQTGQTDNGLIAYKRSPKNCQQQSCSAISCLSSGVNILAGGCSIPLIFATLGSCWMPRSPWARMSLLSSGQV